MNKPDWAALTARYSWLRELATVPQDPLWHGEGDVLTHTKMVLEALLALPGYGALPAASQEELRWAALLHDVEKRSTTKEENGRIVSPNHARRGEFTARRLLYMDEALPFARREHICALVRWHGAPLWLLERPRPERLLVALSLRCDLNALALLAEADVRGRLCPDQKELLERVELFRLLAEEAGVLQGPAQFATPAARFHYLNHDDSPRDYVPYDDGRSFPVWLLSGLPGVGKDHFLREHWAGPVLSLDNLRRAAGIEPTDRKGNGLIIQRAKEEAKRLLRARQPFAFNATNISAELRGRWLELFHAYGAATEIHYLEVPWRQLLAQNRNRPHPVPESVIGQLLGKLELPLAAEAWQLHYHVRDEEPSC